MEDTYKRYKIIIELTATIMKYKWVDNRVE